jgi:hypothetical protein
MHTYGYPWLRSRGLMKDLLILVNDESKRTLRGLRSRGLIESVSSSRQAVLTREPSEHTRFTNRDGGGRSDIDHGSGLIRIRNWLGNF